MVKALFPFLVKLNFENPSFMKYLKFLVELETVKKVLFNKNVILSAVEIQ